MSKIALITGVTGQDGAYLAQLLLNKGYQIFGTSRDAGVSSFNSLVKLGVADKIKVFSMTPHDFKSTLTVISKVRPDEIYHLAGQTSVGLSFEQPSEAFESILIGTLNILESIRFLNLPVKFYHASSSECFGNTDRVASDECTAFNPVSPYAVAKSAAHWLVRNYREAHKMFAVNGILYNHESEIRTERFVTQKVIRAACRIANGSKETLILGDLSISRDWGWAPEYVEAMWLMLQAEQAEDFVLATGQAYALKDFVAESFAYFGLDWIQHVRCSDQFMRLNEISWSQGDAGKAFKILGWQAGTHMKDVVKILCDAQLSNK